MHISSFLCCCRCWLPFGAFLRSCKPSLSVRPLCPVAHHLHSLHCSFPFVRATALRRAPESLIADHPPPSKTSTISSQHHLHPTFTFLCKHHSYGFALCSLAAVHTPETIARPRWYGHCSPTSSSPIAARLPCFSSRALSNISFHTPSVSRALTTLLPDS